jgi:hypothetical protein
LSSGGISASPAWKLPDQDFADRNVVLHPESGPAISRRPEDHIHHSPALEVKAELDEVHHRVLVPVPQVLDVRLVTVNFSVAK